MTQSQLTPTSFNHPLSPEGGTETAQSGSWYLQIRNFLNNWPWCATNFTGNHCGQWERVSRALFSAPELPCRSKATFINLWLDDRWISKNSISYPSVQFSRSVVSDSLRPHGPQHARPPCPSPTPGGYSNSCPFSRWCHPTISSSVVPFSSCLQSFPASGSFQMSQLFALGGQSIGVSASASVLPGNTQDWSPLG